MTAGERAREANNRMRGRARFLLGPDVQFPVTDRWQLNILYEDPEYELLSRQRAAHELEASK